MVCSERFSDLPDYAFSRLRGLLKGVPPGDDPVVMTIGEPQHPMPDWVGDEIANTVQDFGRYPPNQGSKSLRNAIAVWIARRHGVNLTAPDRQILPLNGTREGLFNACLALCPEHKRNKRPIVGMPNPFYQVYAAAACAVGAEPIYLPAVSDTGDLPDFTALPPHILDRMAIAYVCSPANPQGAVADRAYWTDLIHLAETHDFKIFADECYSEIYRVAPPISALWVADTLGADPERVLMFNSLSKRSNMPGLRSGFVAGGVDNIAAMTKLRAYGGAPLPLPLQAVAVRAWLDEDHVQANRALYHEKYMIADTIFADIPGYTPPEAGFFLWLQVKDGESAAVKLWRDMGVKVLPGAYLARSDVVYPRLGYDRIRVAMVAGAHETRDGLSRLKTCLYA